MSLDEELRKADEQRVDAIFDDTWASRLVTESEMEEFTDTEIDIALKNYGILRVIHDRIDEVLPLMQRHGVRSETLGAIVAGSNMVIMALAAYAASETPDTPDGM